jgi:hypothetical protein
MRDKRGVVFYVLGCWLFGLAWIGLLSALASSELPWVVRIARATLVLGVAVVLGATAVIVAAGNSIGGSGQGALASTHPTRTGLWFYSLGCAVPVTLLGLLAARRALARPILSALAALPAVAVLVASAAAFRPSGAKLDGLAATAHDHHALVVAALVLPVALVAAAVASPPRR